MPRIQMREESQFKDIVATMEMVMDQAEWNPDVAQLITENYPLAGQAGGGVPFFASYSGVEAKSRQSAPDDGMQMVLLHLSDMEAKLAKLQGEVDQMKEFHQFCRTSQSLADALAKECAEAGFDIGPNPYKDHPELAAEHLQMLRGADEEGAP